MAQRTGRKRSQLPDCYYEGYLEKTSVKHQPSQKLWACLCGNTLFFFSEKRDNDYVDKLDLAEMISVTDDRNPADDFDSTRFIIRMQNENVKLTASNAEARELWKGFIHSVARLTLPSSLTLLPGQIHMLEDTIHRELERMSNIPPPVVTDHTPSPTSTQSSMPTCFFEVPRLEAELLLEREAGRGNILLRPGSSGSSFAITTRLDHGGPIFKHYKVLSSSAGFYIDVETPVYGDTLQEIVNTLVERTEGHLTPLIIEGQYDQNLTFISPDSESGERTPHTFVPLTMPHKQVDDETRTPEAEPVREEQSSVSDQKVEKENAGGDSSAASRSPKTVPRKILMPPCPAPRKHSPASSTVSTPTPNPREARRLPNRDALKKFPLPAISELKLKLGQKTKPQD